MADNEMDSWDEEEEKEWQEQREQRAKGYNEARYRKEQQRRAASDLRKYRNNYPDRPKVNPCQEKSLHKIQYKGTMWFLMWFQRLTPRLVMRLLKFLLTSLASVYRCLCPCDKSATLPEMQNLDFYLNKKRFKPNGEFIEVILDQWKDDYELLERNNSYIQWLFPLQEQGMNFRARMLTRTEIEMMKKDEEVQRRFIEAYKLMLGFYGIKLVNADTGEVKRTEKFEERFDNLDYHSHNNLRITRILKCLGELGFEHYQAPLVKFFLVETLVEKQLPGVKNSVLDYFLFTVKDKQQRRDLVHFAWENYEPRYKFIWGPMEQLKMYKKPSDCDSDVGWEGEHG
uniref:Opioid growth factor receptor (OGFr) conserved domain-containing protein n=1 Tax=Leptobrachium leishanense TaxID=445787 RepID=A0A8C5R4T9_9ANUR